MVRLLSTRNDVTLALARVTLGAVMLPHGLQKTVGWFGGYGFGGTLGFLTDTMGLPTPVAVTVILAESLFAVLLVFGALSRLSALLIAAVMVGAVVTMHAEHGFFMNWFGAAAGEGFEYHLLALGLASVTMLGGGGAFSVDQVLARYLRAGRTEQVVEAHAA
jgi:putative oxidoreductase